MRPRIRRSVERIERARQLARDAFGHDETAPARAVREATKLDPLAFALVYLRRHIADAETGVVTLSEAHEQWIDHAARWASDVAPEPGQERDAIVAPRDLGKSTWFFLILPMWAAAHGHARFVAAFADSGAQAEQHLATFKRELDTNEALREAFPDLCRPARRGDGGDRGVLVSDNRGLLHTRSGFVFAARGIDSGNLGMKVSERRPDLIILDDIEPGESNYSALQAAKRLATLLNVVLPLNLRARVVLVGTVTMVGSIVHQLVEPSLDAAWVREERFRVHHAEPILQDAAGVERSVWPERWPIEYLRSIRHTRSYALNFLNRPVAVDGAYWTPDTFRYGGAELPTPRCLLTIDPAVTSKATSDFTGLAVVGRTGDGKRCVVKEARRTRATGAALRAVVLAMLEEYPEVTHVLIETNQGGDLWRDILHDLPVRVLAQHSSDPKPVRASEALNHYERGRVLHARPLPDAEQELCGFPRAQHDDLVDAVGAGVNRLLAKPAPKQRASVRAASYV